VEQVEQVLQQQQVILEAMETTQYFLQSPQQVVAVEQEVLQHRVVQVDRVAEAQAVLELELVAQEMLEVIHQLKVTQVVRELNLEHLRMLHLAAVEVAQQQLVQTP
jgi:hypothetical protein